MAAKLSPHQELESRDILRMFTDGNVDFYEWYDSPHRKSRPTANSYLICSTTSRVICQKRLLLVRKTCVENVYVQEQEYSHNTQSFPESLL